MREDDFFGSDPFENIVREIFGSGSTRTPRRRITQEADDEDQSLRFIEDEDDLYALIELPGYSEEDIKISLEERRLTIRAHKEDTSGVAEYLAPKLDQGVALSKTLPAGVGKKYEYTYRNGILEIRFRGGKS